jgi:hypothetical protein
MVTFLFRHMFALHTIVSHWKNSFRMFPKYLFLLLVHGEDLRRFELGTDHNFK